jgi:hypothetical protein
VIVATVITVTTVTTVSTVRTVGMVFLFNVGRKTGLFTAVREDAG